MVKQGVISSTTVCVRKQVQLDSVGSLRPHSALTDLHHQARPPVPLWSKDLRPHKDVSSSGSLEGLRVPSASGYISSICLSCHGWLLTAFLIDRSDFGQFSLCAFPI